MVVVLLDILITIAVQRGFWYDLRRIPGAWSDLSEYYDNGRTWSILHWILFDVSAHFWLMSIICLISLFFVLDFAWHLQDFLQNCLFLQDQIGFEAGVLQVFLQNYFVVITTNYIVVQSSDAYPPTWKIAQKIILLCYFYVALFPHFKLKIHKILYPHTVLRTIYGGIFTFCFFFALYPAGVCLTFPP